MRLIAIALLSVVLPVMTVPSHAKRCTVTVVLADHAGNQQPKTAKEQPCRPGETGGGVEVYNPYTGIYVFHPQIPPVNPRTGQSTGVPGSYTGSDHNAATTPPCTPRTTGPKGVLLPLQPGQHACGAAMSRAPSR